MSILSKIVDNISRQKQIRQENNAYVMHLVKNNMSLATVATSSTWFPPRSINKKDSKAFNMIVDHYGKLYLAVDNTKK